MPNPVPILLLWLLASQMQISQSSTPCQCDKIWLKNSLAQSDCGWLKKHLLPLSQTSAVGESVAQTRQVALMPFDALADIAGALVAFGEIGANILRMPQVVGDDGVNVGQPRGRIAMVVSGVAPS